MEFIKKRILTCVCAVLTVVFYIVSAEGLSTLFLGAAVSAFLFEANIASGLSDSLKKLLKLS